MVGRVETTSLASATPEQWTRLCPANQCPLFVKFTTSGSGAEGLRRERGNHERAEANQDSSLSPACIIMYPPTSNKPSDMDITLSNSLVVIAWNSLMYFLCCFWHTALQTRKIPSFLKVLQDSESSRKGVAMFSDCRTAPPGSDDVVMVT